MTLRRSTVGPRFDCHRQLLARRDFFGLRRADHHTAAGTRRPAHRHGLAPDVGHGKSALHLLLCGDFSKIVIYLVHADPAVSHPDRHTGTGPADAPRLAESPVAQAVGADKPHSPFPVQNLVVHLVPRTHGAHEDLQVPSAMDQQHRGHGPVQRLFQ